MALNISFDLLARAFRDITTGGYFADHDLYPDNVSEYRGAVADLGRFATRAGTFDTIGVGFALVLADPSIDAGALSDAHYPFDDGEARAILAFARAELWPTAGAPPPGTRLIDMPGPKQVVPANESVLLTVELHKGREVKVPGVDCTLTLIDMRREGSGSGTAERGDDLEADVRVQAGGAKRIFTVCFAERSERIGLTLRFADLSIELGEWSDSWVGIVVRRPEPLRSRLAAEERLVTESRPCSCAERSFLPPVSLEMRGGGQRAARAQASGATEQTIGGRRSVSRRKRRGQMKQQALRQPQSLHVKPGDLFCLYAADEAILSGEDLAIKVVDLGSRYGGAGSQEFGDILYVAFDVSQAGEVRRHEFTAWEAIPGSLNPRLLEVGEWRITVEPDWGGACAWFRIVRISEVA